MTSTESFPAPHVYIQSDVPDGQSLIAWRRDLERARRLARPRRRFGLLPRRSLVTS